MVIHLSFDKSIYDIIILPIQLNICFNNIELFQRSINSVDINPVAEVLTSDWGYIFKSYIKQNMNKCIILDLKGIKVHEKVFDVWKELSDISLVYINCDELLVDSMKKIYDKDIVEIKKEDGIYCNLSGKNFIDNNKLGDNFIEKLKVYYIDECANRLSKDGKNEVIKKNNSSNIYTSFYMDIRKLFSISNNMNVFVYGLYKKVESIKDFDCFVVVSNNGAIIVNILSYIFNKEVLYLLNLGPTMALSNKDLKSKIKKDAKYLYIYDFLCLGNELKILDMLLKINGAQLVHGVGVAQLLPSERYEHGAYKIDSLVNLVNYKDMFKYTVSLYEEM